MSLKKIKIISCFGIFVLCFLTHFLYSIFPNTIFSILFPVNESIFEHTKMIASAVIIYGSIEFILLKIFNIKYNNYITNIFLTSVFNVIIFLLIYLPLFKIFGNSTFLNIFTLIISIIISQIISYYILNTKEDKLLNFISVIGIILIYITFALFTYFPLKNDIFYDFKYKHYGIK